MHKRNADLTEALPTVGSSTMRRIRNHKTLAAIGVVAVLAAAGGAYAFWTGSGSGGGSAVVAPGGGTVTVTATVAPGIAPNLSRAVSFTAANATSSAITISGIQLASLTPDSGHSSCVTGDFTMANVDEMTGSPAIGHPVPANATVDVLPINGSLVYHDTTINQDACKGATLTLVLTTT